MNKEKIKNFIKNISQVLINPHSNAITIGMSKRFILFQMMKRVTAAVEKNPYLIFVSTLKNYKILSGFLHGTIGELYKDRNKFYFKNFFTDRELYNLVKEDIEEMHPKYSHIKTVISKQGIMIHDNYQKNNFNILLLTIHAGRWVPKTIEPKVNISEKERFIEEDIDSDKIYSNIVLEKGGVWINNKLSRFICDSNRPQDKCIYFKKKEKWLDKKIWNEKLTKNDIKKIHALHLEFYATLQRLLEMYRFNIIFDGHTMKHKKGRPKISFGTKNISPFYRPIVRLMRDKLRKMKYLPLYFNRPYAGGFILKWLKIKFPDRFIFSMEINKNLYMKANRITLKRKLKKLKNDISHIFDIK